MTETMRWRGLAVHVTEAATGITRLVTAAQAGDRGSYARAVLTWAAAGFAVGGLVNQLLNDYGLPRREVFAVAEDRCGQMMLSLQELLGPDTLSVYAVMSGAELQYLQDKGREELLDGTPETTEQVAAALVTLGAALKAATGSVADEPEIEPALRGAARMSVDAADLLHTHLGGDAGGW